ncbi:hypothetical protein [Arcobacter lacus]|nr:hypothetical protein [Arcobacter lacus]
MMIFIGLFFGIITIVISLNVYNHINLDKIEDYLKTINCKDFIYSKGSYKAFCENNIIEIKNSFIIDLKNNQILEIAYKDIKKLEERNENLYISTINKDYKIEFKEKNDLKKFREKLDNKTIGEK